MRAPARPLGRRMAAHPLTDGRGALPHPLAGSAQAAAPPRGRGGSAQARRVDIAIDGPFLDATESPRRGRCCAGARAAPGGRPAAPAPGALGRAPEPSGRSWEVAPAAKGRFRRHDGLYGCVGRGSHVLRCIRNCPPRPKLCANSVWGLHIHIKCNLTRIFPEIHCNTPPLQLALNLAPHPREKSTREKRARSGSSANECPEKYAAWRPTPGRAARRVRPHSSPPRGRTEPPPATSKSTLKKGSARGASGERRDSARARAKEVSVRIGSKHTNHEPCSPVS